MNSDDYIVIPKATLDKIFKENKSGILVAVYALYNYTSKWQKTNQPWANDTYVGKRLGISKGTARKYRTRLQELGLIESITKVRNKNGRFTKSFIKMKYILKKTTVEQITEQQTTDNG